VVEPCNKRWRDHRQKIKLSVRFKVPLVNSATLDAPPLSDILRMELVAIGRFAHQAHRAHSLEPRSFKGLKLVIPSSSV
jgi:hypothetical protein